MPTITLPPTVATGDTIDANTWNNVARTALDRLPRGLMSQLNYLTQTTAHAAGIGTSETTANLVSTAVATEAGRTYKITFEFELRNAQALTSYGTWRARRGTGTNGAIHATLGSNTLIAGPAGLSKRAGTASRDTVIVTILDAPGAVSAQQWTLTLQADAATLDVYRPVLITVEDTGVTP